MISPRGGDFYLATSGDRNLTIDTTYGSFNFRQDIKLVNLERNKGTVRTPRFRTIIGLISGPAIIAAGLGGPS
jgi:hypothetical protein